jgi:signal transduction histidine kinase
MNIGRLFRVTSVRVRLTLWNMAVLALALIGCAFIVHTAVTTFLIASIDQDLRDEAEAALLTASLHGMADQPMFARLQTAGGQPGHSPNTGAYQQSLYYRRDANPLPGGPHSGLIFKVNTPGPGPMRASNSRTVWITAQSGSEPEQVATKRLRESSPRQLPHAGVIAAWRLGPAHTGRKPPPDAAPRLPDPPPIAFSPEFSELHRFVVMRLLDSRGHMLPQRSQPASEEVPMLDRQLALAGRRERILTLTANHQEWRVLTRPLTAGGEVTGSVQVAYPLQDLQSLLRGLDRTLLVLIPLALLITGLGGAFLTDRTLRPVRWIARAAGDVEGTDLSRRLPVTGGDEFAELATTFNSMFARLEIAFSSLETAVEQQRRFTADASHELRTPLTTIKANADWALRRRRRVAEYQETLTAIAEAADRTNRLIANLLQLARSDHDRSGFEPQTVRVEEVLRRACAASPPTAGQACLCLDLPAVSLLVRGDVDQLERLVINLLENSLRHTPEEGQVRVSAYAASDRILITVEDNGEGIAPEHLPHVCERFYRADAARSRPGGGAGLGLAICCTIARAHGGTLEIQSTSGIGTVVTVSLPRAERDHNGLDPVQPD